MNVPPDEWLEALNRQYRAQGIPAGRRPTLAMDRFCRDFGARVLAFHSPPATRIFRWFSENTKLGAIQIRSLFTGAFYYDTSFWAVDIPVVYGSVCLEAPDSLRGMPSGIRQDLLKSGQDAWSYAFFWVDCLDYAYGLDDMAAMTSLDPFGVALLRSGNRELRASVSLLLEAHPNSAAALSGRMALEMFLKAFLVLKFGLSQARVRHFRHDIPRLIEECKRLAPGHDLVKIEGAVALLPEISTRYTGESLTGPELWDAYGLAQGAAAATVRSFTERDSRKALRPKPPMP